MSASPQQPIAHVGDPSKLRRRRAPRSLLVVALIAAVLVVATPTPASATASFSFSRLAGTDRYDTAHAIAVDAAPTSDRAILTTGQNFPDALAGSYLAGRLGVPILLTTSTSLSQSALSALATMKVKTVTILGGTAAVAASVEDDLKAKGYAVERVSGASRYETAKLVAEGPGAAGVGELDGARTAIVATGENFPDAVAVGPVAYAAGFPVLLTTKSSLSPEAKDALANLTIKRVLILGGTAAVSSSVESDVKALGIDVTRVAGTDRSDTAAKLGDLALSALGFSATHVNLARGDAFADALAGGPHGGREKAVTLLTQSSTVLGPPTASWLEAHVSTLASGTIFGGVAAVSDAVKGEAETAAGRPLAAPTIAVTGGPADNAVTKETTPTYAGTAADSDGTVAKIDVDVTSAASTVASATCTGCGTPSATWTFKPASALPSGDVTFTFTAVDNAGQKSSPVSRTLRIDSGVPTFDTVATSGGSTTVSAIFSEPLDCLSVAKEDFTSTINTAASIVGSVTCSGAASSSVQLTLGAAPIAGDTVEVALVGSVLDRAGNEAAKATKSVTVTNAKTPTVSVTTQPSDPTNDTTPTIGGEAKDDDGTVKQVEARIDGAAFSTAGVTCTGCSTANATWTYTPASAVGAGSHTFEFQAIDNTSAASAVRPAVTITIDTTPPNLVSASGKALDPKVTTTFNDSLDCTTVAASDFAATVNGASSTVTGAACSGAAVVLTLGTTPLGGDIIAVSVAAGALTDKAGNANTAGNASIPLPNTAPTTTVGSPADGVYTPDNRPVFSGGAADADGHVAKVVVTKGGQSQPDAVCTSCGTQSATWSYRPATALDQGTYAFTFQAVDNTTGTDGTKVSRTITVDSLAPTLTGASASVGEPVVTAVFSEAIDCATVSTATAATDFGVSVDGVPVEIDAVDCAPPASSGIRLTLKTAPKRASDPVAVSLPSTADIRDRAGNKAAPASVSTSVVSGAPHIAITGGPAHNATTGDTTPTYSGTADDIGDDGQTNTADDGSVKEVAARIYTGSAVPSYSTADVTCAACGTGAVSVTWSFTSTTQVNGTYTVEFQVTDNIGNKTPISRTVTISDPAPHMTINPGPGLSAALTDPVPQSLYTNNTSLSYTGTASDTGGAGADDDGVVDSITATINGAPVGGAPGNVCTSGCKGSVGGTAQWAIPTTLLTVGLQTIEITAIDKGGKTSLIHLDVLIDVQRPTFDSVTGATALGNTVVANFTDPGGAGLLCSSAPASAFTVTVTVNSNSQPDTVSSVAGCTQTTATAVTLTLQVPTPSTATVEVTVATTVTDRAGNALADPRNHSMEVPPP